MPGKKKGKKSGKKAGTKKSGKGTKSDAPEERKDPLAPQYPIPPPLRTGERLIKLMTTVPVQEKELYGFKVSTRALEKLTPQEIRDLRIVYEAFDVRGYGFIGPIEVRRAMKALGFRVSREQVRQIVQDASISKKGVVDFNEFLDIVIDNQKDDKDIYDEILQGFKLFDYEENGKISGECLKQACKETGLKFSKEEIQDMMMEADLNGDGFVDKDEFIKIMLQTNLF